MERKILDMGTLSRLLLLITFLFYFENINAQIINIEKGDSIELIKKTELKDNNTIFYKNEYTLIIYKKEHIEYNKKNGFSYKKFAGGREYCDKCKKEKYVFSIKKINTNKIPKLNKLEIFNQNYLFKNLKKYQFSYGYFCINNIYYENLGMPIE